MASEFELSFQGEANLYVILRRSSDADVWNGSAFVSWDTDDLASYALALSSRGGDVYQGDFPTPDPAIAAGKYRVLYYQRAGETPLDDDLLLSTRSLYWNGQAVDKEPASSVEVDEMALTTVEDVAAYLRLDDLSSEQTSLLAALVNQVSARIERICSRQFKARRWVERHTTPHNGQITLNHYPVLSVNRLLTGASETMRVSFSVSGALEATAYVQFDHTGVNGNLCLSSTAADGTQSITNLSLTTYATTTSLTAAIENIEGWSAVVVSLALTSQLHEMSSRDALSQAVSLMQPNQSLNWWDLDTRIGRLELWQRMGSVVVDYRAGYETIPADLQLTTTQMVAQAFQAGRQNAAVTSESLGNYSYTLATQSQISDDLWSKLRLYMQVR